MVDAKIATSAEQPINSDGAVSTAVGEEGDLVSLDANGELVQADAANGTPAVGVLATPVDDPSTYPDGQFEYAAKLAESNRAAVNEHKVGYVRYGVELVNRDDDWGFTPGEPVYLASGGGYTQTAPTGAGETVQVVGYAIEPEAVFVEIDADYSTV